MTLAAASSLYGRYLEPIGSGFVAFLVLAAALAVPYVAWSYRRRGRVDPRQVWVAATFALFLLCAWALVLVPFPDRDTICSVRHVDAQLVPLRWVADTLREAGREGTGLAGLVSNGPFVVRVFNVALLLPLGVFLRRWWGASLGRTALVGLLLSLAFELTQWTGVWGIYPCAYRTFDVDDLMANTLGAVLGWLVAPAIVLVPRRAGAPAVPGLYPSLPRRLLAAALDYVLAALVGGLLWALAASAAGLPAATGTWARAALLLGLLLVALAPPAAGRSTPGQWLLGLRVVATGMSPARSALVRFAVVWIPVVCLLTAGDALPVGSGSSTGLLGAWGAVVLWVVLLAVLTYRDGARRGPQDRWSGSTVEEIARSDARR